MLDKINIMNAVSFRSSVGKSQNMSNPVDNKPRKFNSEFYVDSKGADAVKSRNFMPNPIEINKPISMSDYKNKLINAGLVEDKDFHVIKDDNGGAIFVTKGQEEPIKSIYWHEGTDVGANSFSGYVDRICPINQKGVRNIEYSYDKDCNLESIAKTYINPDKHTDLFPQNIDINTTPEEYVKILKQKNVKYEIDKEKLDNNETMTSLYEYDNNTDRYSKKITFFENPNGEKAIYYDDLQYDAFPKSGVRLTKYSDRYEMQVIEYIDKNAKIKKNAKY